MKETQSNYVSSLIKTQILFNYVWISLVCDDLTAAIWKGNVIAAAHNFAIGFFLATLLRDKIFIDF